MKIYRHGEAKIYKGLFMKASIKISFPARLPDISFSRGIGERGFIGDVI